MWGIIPAAGSGSRLQPLACSKELLPVGSWADGAVERPKATSEYLVERMIQGGADRLCFIISPGKVDILEYYAGRHDAVHVTYVVQPKPAGLCDALFRAVPLVRPEETVLVGLPDTIWFPEEAYRELDDEGLSFLLFPVDRPEFFDAVLCDEEGRVREIQVKRTDAASSWIWGGFKLTGAVLHELHQLWLERRRQDDYFGTLVNAWLARGGQARGVPAGTDYVDVGTLAGYHDAIRLLRARGCATAGRELVLSAAPDRPPQQQQQQEQ